MMAFKTGTVPLSEYNELMEANRKLLKENTDLKIQVSYLQKTIAKLKEAKLYVN